MGLVPPPLHHPPRRCGDPELRCRRFLHEPVHGSDCHLPDKSPLCPEPEYALRLRAAELRKHERSLPISGLHASYISSYKRDSRNLPPFKIVTNPGANYFLKLSDWGNGRPILSIFIRGGEEVEVGIPPGIYRIKLASGATWYGEDIRFGPDTDYSVVDKPSEFRIQGNQLLGHELRLVNVRDGNLRRRPITASEF